MRLLALLLLAAASPPVVTSEKLGDGHFRLTLKAARISTPEAGQSLLLTEATRLCAGQPVYFGHYRWSGVDRADDDAASAAPVSLTLVQEMTCGIPPGAPPAPARPAAPPLAPAAAFQPSAGDLTEVVDRSRRFYELRNQGRYADAWAMLTPSMQEMAPLAHWREDAAATGRKVGKLRLTPVAVTWYDHPADAQVSGVFAAVDFTADATDAALVCGYLIWLRQEDGSWRLMREQLSFVDRASAKGATPSKIEALRGQLGCRKA
jgi:hypothetical protein